MNKMKSLKTKIENMKVCAKENKAICVAIILLMLSYGLMDFLVKLIDKTIAHLTAFPRNAWLDWVFVVITMCLLYGLCLTWIKTKKIITARTVAQILVPLALYVFFRLKTDSPYIFTSYWNGPVSYLDGFAIIGLGVICLYLYQQLRKSLIQKVDSKYAFGSDVPINSSDKDLFNMGSLVKRIVNYIVFTDVSDTAFSMGLIGEWGDGKTSLMNLVEERIRNTHKDFIIIRFNPRSSKKADYIQEDFLDSLKQALSPHHTGIDRTIDKYAEALDVIPGIPPVVSKGLEVLQLKPDKERDIKRGDLKKAIVDIGRRIVVLVDDLDRLTGEELIEVLKVLDTNGAFPNMVFLTSYDKKYVNTVLNNYLKLGKQSCAYTDKYFTVEIRVPLHPSFRLLDYLVKILKDAVTSGFIITNASTIEDQTRKMSSYIMSRLYTIRDVKRFANQFLYDFAEVQRDVNYRDYFLLELIKYSHPEDYEAIYRFKYIHRGKTSFLSSSSEDLLYLNADLLPKIDGTGAIKEKPIIEPNSMDILRTLFPEESNYQSWYPARFQRIYSSSSFEHYFYNYEYSHLKAEDIARLYSEQNIKDVCKLIDDWSDFSKDLETYLLTRDVNSIENKNVLRRFMQILLYASHKHKSINYLGHNYTFLRTEDVNQIMKNCGFGSLHDYLKWFKETMAELTEINALIPSIYLRTPIGATFSDNAASDLFIISRKEMQDYALKLFEEYLKKIGTEGWDVNTAYFMSQIQSDEKGNSMPEANKALHDVMIKHFGTFSASLPYYAEDYEGVHVGYTIRFHFSSVFSDKEEFETLINSVDFNTVPEIELIRAIWPIYKANGCCNFILPKGMSMEEVKKNMLKTVLAYLPHYDEINQKVRELDEEWKQRRQLPDVQSFVNRAMDLLKDLRSIPLNIKIKEIFENQINDMITVFQKYEETTKKEGDAG